MSRKNKGVTLIELAICFVLIGILAAIAMPNFATMAEDAQAETMRSIASDVEMWVSQGLSRGVAFDSLTSHTDLLDDIASNVQTDFSGGDVNITLTAGAGRTIDVAMTSTGASNKAATLQINTSGNVRFSSVSGFSHHAVVNGDLKKT